MFISHELNENQEDVVKVNLDKAYAIAEKVVRGKPFPKNLTQEEKEWLIIALKDLKDVPKLSGIKIKKGLKDNTLLEDYYDYDDNDIIDLAVNANKFFKENKITFISENLRKGFIGKEIYDEDGTKYVQMSRGKPYGTAVAIKTEDDVVIGYAFLNPKDKKIATPEIGRYLALSRAIEGQQKGKRGFEPSPILDAETKAQLKHFEKRALTFFYPEKYSYSKGTDPVHYENFDRIHKIQKFFRELNKKKKVKKSKK